MSDAPADENFGEPADQGPTEGVTIDGRDATWRPAGDLAIVVFPDHGVRDGLNRVTDTLAEVGVSTLTLEHRGGWYADDRAGGAGPRRDWMVECLRPWLATRCRAAGLLGVGVGGQAALLAAYRRGDLWACVAAVAPACDLGRWHGRGTTLDDAYETAADARQAEAPLFYNPLSAARRQLVWCDPRDEPCHPSALRAVSKVQSSGGRVDADLETEAGSGRNGYVAARAAELAGWTAEAVRDAADRPPLPLL